MKGFEVGPYKFLVANIEGQFSPFAQSATTWAGLWRRAGLDGEVVAFPWLGSRWYAKTGKVIQFARVLPPERVYKVTADGEQISVEMEG